MEGISLDEYIRDVIYCKTPLKDKTQKMTKVLGVIDDSFSLFVIFNSKEFQKTCEDKIVKMEG